MSDPCPIECPNRERPNVLKVFGLTVDPIGLTLHFAVVAILLIPASRRSMSADFTWKEGAGWLGAIALFSALVQVSPTQRLDASMKLFEKIR
ncbi:hypothetical protein H6F43_03070 [Leptolyngbya sp. FACHB-36]|uniref:hypothetical protein n=1 Tax=Leptolyngbya sp. FACHB-36 TaxID=2692808 RepID=UPI0016819366|nr:hypothetical protein [Leptolyngbya sp. FACHB-36]MBD2019165.1 hypothetical protein [Leptolyngbya sp. FACHB-36]